MEKCGYSAVQSSLMPWQWAALDRLVRGKSEIEGPEAPEAEEASEAHEGTNGPHLSLSFNINLNLY